MKSKKTVECPTCGETVHLESWLRAGVQFLCPFCEELLEIIKLKPVVVNCVYSTDHAEYEEVD